MIQTFHSAVVARKNAAGGSSLLTDLIAYWNLNEVSGNRADSVGSNTLVDNNTVGSTAGKVSNAAQFVEANSEYFLISDNVDMSVSSSFTFAGWMRSTTDQSTRAIIEKQNEYRLRRSSADNMVFSVFNAAFSDATVTDATTITAGTWYFVVAWYDVGDGRTHLQINDGVVSDSAATILAPRDGNSAFSMGLDQAEGFYNGDMDEWGFWKRVLTSGEKTTLYNSGNGTTYPF